MKRALLAAASWLLVGLGHPAVVPWLAPLTAIGGFALFWASLEGVTSRWRRCWLAMAWFGAVQLLQTAWLVSLDYQGLYIIVLYLILALAVGLQFGILTALLPRGGHWTWTLALAAAWVFMERLRLNVGCGWSWNPVGLSLTASHATLPMASLAGIYGLSLLTLLTNGLALAAWRQRSAKLWAGWMVLAALPMVYGLTAQLRFSNDGGTAHVWLMQTGLTPNQKQRLPGREKEMIPLIDQWAHMVTLLPKGQPALLVLPEAAVIGDVNRPLYDIGLSNGELAQRLAHQLQTMVVAGFDCTDPDSTHHASAFCYGTGTPQRYDKRILLPIAEYLPRIDLLHKIARYYGIAEGYTPGKTAMLFDGPLRVAPTICYEETHSHLIWQSAQLNPDLLVNVTNDGWYPNTLLPEHHLMHGRVRSAELGIPLVRSCHTGVTAAIDCHGRILARLDQPEGVLAVDLPLGQIQTPYRQTGETPLLLLCSLLLVPYGALLVRKRMKDEGGRMKALRGDQGQVGAPTPRG